MNFNTSEYDSTSGVVFEIERFSVNDGPGIRTLVFLKGCPLRCAWCANPESHSFSPQLLYWKARCIGCLECIKTCPRNALTAGKDGINVDRTSCVSCGMCTTACNSKALLLSGRYMTAAAVMDEVKKDSVFYEKSGGGVTFSGGEVLSQPLFLLSLLKAAKREGIHTCIETSGYAPRSILEEIAPYVDTFLYDLKAIDDAVHFVCCSVSNKQILENFEYLCERCNVVARLPIIPGYNDAPKDIDLMLEYLESHHRGGHVDLLPYHRLGVNKYTRLDMPYHLKDILPPSPKRMAELKQQFISRGFSTEIGG